jgi:hypothetical protein
VRTVEGGVFCWGERPIPAATQTALDASAGFDTVTATNNAFLVRTVEGGVYAWGNSIYGGTIPAATQAALDASARFNAVEATEWAFLVRAVVEQGYLCTLDQCVPAPTGTGVGLRTCLLACGDGRLKYRCAEDECMLSAEGVDLEECETACPELYVCTGGACVPSATGVDLPICEAICTPGSD